MLGGPVKRRHKDWGAENLGDEFRKRISQLDVRETTIIPLLHVSIARGRYIRSHDLFTNEKGCNYFKFVGRTIAQKLLENRDKLNIWIV